MCMGFQVVAEEDLRFAASRGLRVQGCGQISDRGPARQNDGAYKFIRTRMTLNTLYFGKSGAL